MVEIVEEKVRRREEPEKWPLPGPPIVDYSQTDFSQLQDEVRRTKQMAAIDEFLDKKIAETRITIDPMFKDCEFRRPGWASKFSED